METAEIIQRFQWLGKGFEQEAVEAALARREEVTPALLGILEDVADRGAEVDKDGTYMGHLYATYLLAQFRETRAYPLIVRIALLPSDELEELWGDFTTTDLDSVLASVCGGDLSGIKSLIENDAADEWARGAGIDAILVLVAAGLMNREEAVDYFATLYRGKLARTAKNEQVWSQLVYSSTEIYPAELMGDIERVYADDLVDPTFIAIEDVKETLARGKDSVLASLAASPHHQLINDTIETFGTWACFEEDADEETDPDEDDLADFDWDDDEFDAGRDPLEPYLVQDQYGTVRRTAPKIGRNDPCFCGSGKKYKKCCGQ